MEDLKKKRTISFFRCDKAINVFKAIRAFHSIKLTQLLNSNFSKIIIQNLFDVR